MGLPSSDFVGVPGTGASVVLLLLKPLGLASDDNGALYFLCVVESKLLAEGVLVELVLGLAIFAESLSDVEDKGRFGVNGVVFGREDEVLDVDIVVSSGNEALVVANNSSD